MHINIKQVSPAVAGPLVPVVIEILFYFGCGVINSDFSASFFSSDHFFFVFHAKSGATNNHRNSSNDI